MKFRDFIQPGSVVVSLQSQDRDGAIRELVTALSATGGLDPSAVDEIVNAMLDRENSGTTGFGRGVAAPHVKHPRIRQLVGAVGLSARGIDFEALDRKPVYVVFILLSPQGHDQQHLQAMEVVFRSLKEEAFRRSLRLADTPEKVMALLDEADAAAK
ncbi:MAG: fruA 1 [Capsulimonas sp.]|nr:fruA 1 [Capsulimonas sp.]